MKKSTIEIIAKLINDNGIEVLAQRKMVGMLKDMVPEDRESIKLLTIFADSNIGLLIIKGFNEKQKWTDLQKMAVQKLNRDFFLDTVKANELMSGIGEAITIANGHTATEKNKSIISQLKEISIKNVKVVKSITVSGNTYHKYDIVSFDGSGKDSRLIYSICLADNEIYVYAETGSKERQNGKEVFIHSRQYGIYRIDNENYFNKVTDKSVFLALGQYLLDGMRKGLYGVLTTTFLSEWVTDNDIDIAKNALINTLKSI